MGGVTRGAWRRLGGTPLLWAVTGLLSVFLFWGGPGADSPRSVGHGWDLGHVVLFGVGTAAALRSRFAPRGRFGRQAAWVALVTLALGVAIEVGQGGFDRSGQAGDVGRDLVGSLVALAFFAPARRSLGTAARWGLRLAAVGAVLGSAAPLAVALVDEALARHRFPVLADLETPFELGRWTGDAGLRLSGDVARGGGRALRVDLTTARYSGAFLTHFPRDWRGYGSLRLSLYNPGPEPLTLVLRLHDAAHPGRGYAYDDRFNQACRFPPGWTDLEVPLAAVAAAPRGRTLDLGRVQSLGLFAVGLAAPRRVYLDEVRLVP